MSNHRWWKRHLSGRTKVYIHISGCIWLLSSSLALTLTTEIESSFKSSNQTRTKQLEAQLRHWWTFTMKQNLIFRNVCENLWEILVVLNRRNKTSYKVIQEGINTKYLKEKHTQFRQQHILYLLSCLRTQKQNFNFTNITKGNVWRIKNTFSI